MQYHGRHDGYTATQDEVAALPDYYAAHREHGYFLPLGQYRGQGNAGVVMVVDVLSDPLSKYPRELWSHIRFVESEAA